MTPISAERSLHPSERLRVQLLAGVTRMEVDSAFVKKLLAEFDAVRLVKESEVVAAATADAREHLAGAQRARTEARLAYAAAEDVMSRALRRLIWSGLLALVGTASLLVALAFLFGRGAP